MSKSYSFFLVHPPPCYMSDQKRVCNRVHQCVCSCSYLYYSHEYKLCRCAETTTPSRPGTQPLVMPLCGVFWRSDRNNYLLVLVMRALAMSIHVRTYLPKFNNEMHYYYDIIPTAIPWGFFCTVNIICFWTKYDANSEIMSRHMYIKIRRTTREYRSYYIFLRASRLSRSASIRVHVEVPNG